MKYPACLNLSAADLQASNSALLSRERARRAASYTGSDPRYATSTALSNTTANRYSDILPYDSTLVRLGGYVNASWVTELALSDSSIPRRKWIAAQAPLQHTLQQFWEMFLLEENAPSLCIMLTGWTERGIEKCFLYFDTTLNMPLTISPTLSVTLTSSILSDDESYKTNLITLTTPSVTKQITQIEYLNWPDHGVPSSPSSLLQLAQSTLSQPGPILIHCSAGVGRTGTFIAISNLLRYIDDLEACQGDAVGNVVDRLRECRCSLVQTGEQLEFVRESVRVAWREKHG